MLSLFASDEVSKETNIYMQFKSLVLLNIIKNSELEHPGLKKLGPQPPKQAALPPRVSVTDLPKIQDNPNPSDITSHGRYGSKFVYGAGVERIGCERDEIGYDDRA